MFQRLSRMIRSFVGFFISVAEDPELILQQNIRDMNDQVPRMNESIAMVKANVTLLEREEAKYKTDMANLTAKIKAAIQANRDDIAGQYASQLEQTEGRFRQKSGTVRDRARCLRQSDGREAGLYAREGPEDARSSQCHRRLPPLAVAEEGRRCDGAIRGRRHQPDARRDGAQDRGDDCRQRSSHGYGA